MDVDPYLFIAVCTVMITGLYTFTPLGRKLLLAIMRIQEETERFSQKDSEKKAEDDLSMPLTIRSKYLQVKMDVLKRCIEEKEASLDEIEVTQSQLVNTMPTAEESLSEQYLNCFMEYELRNKEIDHLINAMYECGTEYVITQQLLLRINDLPKDKFFQKYIRNLKKERTMVDWEKSLLPVITDKDLEGKLSRLLPEFKNLSIDEKGMLRNDSSKKGKDLVLNEEVKVLPKYKLEKFGIDEGLGSSLKVFDIFLDNKKLAKPKGPTQPGQKFIDFLGQLAHKQNKSAGMYSFKLKDKSLLVEEFLKQRLTVDQSNGDLTETKISATHPKNEDEVSTLLSPGQSGYVDAMSQRSESKILSPFTSSIGNT